MADRLRPFRIGLGALCALDLLAWACDARTWLTDDGVVPRSSLEAVAPWPWRWSVLRLVGSTGAVRLVIAVGVLAAVVVAVGRAQRIASLALVVVLASVHARSPFALSGADLAIGVLAVWWLVLVWCRPHPLARRAALACARLQVAVIYAVPLARRVANGSDTWLSGAAFARVLALRSVTRPFPADALADLPDAVLRVGSWFVLLVEVALVVVIVAIAVAGSAGSSWRPRVSPVVLGCGVVLHLAMGAVLRLGLFPFVLPVAYLLLVRDVEVTASGRGASRVVGAGAVLVVAVLGASVLAESVAQVATPGADPTRHRWSPVLAASGLWQRWDLFAPDVAATDRWVRVEARGVDGRWRSVGAPGPDRGAGIAALRRRKLGDNARADPALARLVLRAACRDRGAVRLRLVLRHSDGTGTVLSSGDCRGAH